MTPTARQIRDMITHIQNCEQCSGADDDINASVYDESLASDELEDYIAGSHDPQWRAFLGGGSGPEVVGGGGWLARW